MFWDNICVRLREIKLNKSFPLRTIFVCLKARTQSSVKCAMQTGYSGTFIWYFNTQQTSTPMENGVVLGEIYYHKLSVGVLEGGQGPQYQS